MGEMPWLEDVVTRDPGQERVLDQSFDHNRWTRLDETQLGIDVIDPDGSQIGYAACIRTRLGLNLGGWKPADDTKRVLVGELDDYEFYNPRFTSGDEADMCLMINPDEPFRSLLDDVINIMTADQQEELKDRKRGPGHTIECEVTPDQEYYDNQWFPTSGGQSPLIGRQVGVYGPWVRDLGHGGRPEIHPCEVIWWRSGNVAFANARVVRWIILVLQDDSNRFDRQANYDSAVPRPWSASPRRARLTVALSAPRGKEISYDIRMRDGRRVFEWPGEEGQSKTVTSGDTVLHVRKRMSRRSEVKVSVSGLSPDPADPNFLRCFLRMDVRVGDGDDGQEGFAELEVVAFDPDIVQGVGGEAVDNPPNPPNGPWTNDPNAPREP